jgi:hypothetical protein
MKGDKSFFLGRQGNLNYIVLRRKGDFSKILLGSAPNGMKMPLGHTSFSSTWVTFGSWMFFCKLAGTD